VCRPPQRPDLAIAACRHPLRLRIAAFLPRLQRAGNVLADFFTARAPAQMKAPDAAKALIYLAAAVC
jgi:hypothetical protein